MRAHTNLGTLGEQLVRGHTNLGTLGEQLVRGHTNLGTLGEQLVRAHTNLGTLGGTCEGRVRACNQRQLMPPKETFPESRTLKQIGAEAVLINHEADVHVNSYRFTMWL